MDYMREVLHSTGNQNFNCWKAWPVYYRYQFQRVKNKVSRDLNKDDVCSWQVTAYNRSSVNRSFAKARSRKKDFVDLQRRLITKKAVAIFFRWRRRVHREKFLCQPRWLVNGWIWGIYIINTVVLKHNKYICTQSVDIVPKKWMNCQWHMRF